MSEDMSLFDIDDFVTAEAQINNIDPVLFGDKIESVVSRKKFSKTNRPYVHFRGHGPIPLHDFIYIMDAIRKGSSLNFLIVESDELKESAKEFRTALGIPEPSQENDALSRVTHYTDSAGRLQMYSQDLNISVGILRNENGEEVFYEGLKESVFTKLWKRLKRWLKKDQ